MDTLIRRLEIEWQTKALATFIAHTVPNEKAQTALLRSAQQLSLAEDDNQSEIHPRSADTSGGRVDTRTLEEIMEHGNTEAALQRNLHRKGPGLPFMN